MRRSWVLFAALACAGSPLRAEEPASPDAAPAGEIASTTRQGVRDVVAAFMARDAAALQRLAARDDPDPWLVAEELIRLRETAVAAAFAAATDRPDAAALTAYVRRRRSEAQDEIRRARLLEAMRLLRAKDAEQALAVSQSAVGGEMPDVLDVRLRVAAAQALKALGRTLEASAAFEDAGGAAERLGWLSWAARALNDAFLLLSDDLARSLGAGQRILERYVAVAEVRSNRTDLAYGSGNLGHIHRCRGDLARSLTLYERAWELLDGLGDVPGAAWALQNVANLQHNVGDPARALASWGRARAAWQALGDRKRQAYALSGTAAAHFALGQHAEAITAAQAALGEQRSLADPGELARTLTTLAKAQHAAGDPAAAIDSLREAHAAALAGGDEGAAAWARGCTGVVLGSMGQDELARVALEQAAALSAGSGDRAGQAAWLEELGRLEGRAGRFDRAIHLLRESIAESGSGLRGLGADERVGAGEQVADRHQLGVYVAVEAGRAEDALHFIESSRAVALAEGVAARSVLAELLVPAHLQTALSDAMGREGTARIVARGMGALPATERQVARLRWAQAQDEVGHVISRIQREARAAAAIVYPQPIAREALQAALGPHECLVIYAALRDRVVALVLTPGECRASEVGSMAGASGLLDAMALHQPDRAPPPAMTQLAEELIQPLRLPPEVRRVLISPDGPLAYVPFAALMPDKTVVYVPSATTYVLLREEEALRGEGVLALGDPDYATKVDQRALEVHRGGGKSLPPLPGTRAEAQAVGTVTLLGAEATEAGLADALAKRQRWRSVHLACHGLVNVERPALSSLAITAAGDDDGFLSCLDVFRMKIPADLVVLSACETGKGKIAKAEGLVGFTRAFMFAGTPRVICSLWKVDDEATAALMLRFYELWNPKDGKPGLPTAEALRGAQEHVRAQEKWRHPYYWAAWVLWGLPA